MIVLESNNFTKLYLELLRCASASKDNVTPSRNGAVIDLGPSVFSISGDAFRMPVLLGRGYNPFFAIAESAWVLSGDNEVTRLRKYLEKIADFSDDGITLNGAYGFRLRKFFAKDQIEEAISTLSQDKETRRVVLQIWDTSDLGKNSLDIPCNTQVMLKIKENKLNITVINRSNDLFLGVPYNVFIFFILQCYLAKRLQLDVGVQTHFTDSLHLYKKNLASVDKILKENASINFEKLRTVTADYEWNFFNCNDTCQKILDGLTGEISNTTLSQAMHLFEEKNLLSTKNLSNCSMMDPLVMVALLWHNTFGRYEQIQDVYRVLFMNKNQAFFERYRYMSSEELKIKTQLFSENSGFNVVPLREALHDSHYNVECSDNQLSQYFFLSSVLATIDVSCLHDSERTKFLGNFQSASSSLNIDYSFVAKLTAHVEKFWE